MAQVTLRVLDGADRGQVFDLLPTPITIGREEGNTVQLNDERISRFHIKIQEDNEKIVLTDLESTNGTRVNGEETQLRILRFGDIVHVGRSVLLYGTRQQIAARLDDLRAEGIAASDSVGMDLENLSRRANDSSSPFEVEWEDSENLRSTLHIPSPPEPPEGLTPAQAAQVSEILEYLHLRSRSLVQSVKLPEGDERVQLDLEQWQDMLDLHALMAEYLRRIGDPGLE
ncbi:MAG: FHA domain-containing protein [Planctomycetota bacterium]